MPLESGTYIDDLNIENPVGATDSISQGDNHLRLIKSVLKGTFPDASKPFFFKTVKAAKSDSYLVQAEDDNSCIPLNTATRTFTVSLPDAGEVKNGFVITFIKADAGEFKVTIDGHGSQLIGLEETVDLRLQHEHLTVVSDGTKWFVLSSTFASQIWKDVIAVTDAAVDEGVNGEYAVGLEDASKILKAVGDVILRLPPAADVGNGFAFFVYTAGTSTSLYTASDESFPEREDKTGDEREQILFSVNKFVRVSCDGINFYTDFNAEQGITKLEDDPSPTLGGNMSLGSGSNIFFLGTSHSRGAFLRALRVTGSTENGNYLNIEASTSFVTMRIISNSTFSTLRFRIGNISRRSTVSIYNPQLLTSSISTSLNSSQGRLNINLLGIFSSDIKSSQATLDGSGGGLLTKVIVGISSSTSTLTTAASRNNKVLVNRYRFPENAVGGSRPFNNATAPIWENFSYIFRDGVQLPQDQAIEVRETSNPDVTDRTNEARPYHPILKFTSSVADSFVSLTGESGHMTLEAAGTVKTDLVFKAFEIFDDEGNRENAFVEMQNAKFSFTHLPFMASTLAPFVTYIDSDGVLTRISKGAANQALSMNAAATAVEWADGVSSTLTGLENHVTIAGQFDFSTFTVGDGDTYRGFINARGRVLVDTGTSVETFREAGTLVQDNVAVIAIYQSADSGTRFEIEGVRLATSGGFMIRAGTTGDFTSHDLTFVGSEQSNFVADLMINRYSEFGFESFIVGNSYQIKLKKEDGTFLNFGIEKVTLDKDVRIASDNLTNLNTVNENSVDYFAGGVTGSPVEDEDGEVITLYGDASNTSQVAVTGSGNLRLRTKRNADDYGSWIRSVTDKDTYSTDLILINAFVVVSGFHGHGAVPSQIWAELVCVAPVAGYAIGDVYAVEYLSTGSSINMGLLADDEIVRLHATFSHATIIRKNITFSNITLDTTASRANWKLKLYARK